MGDKQEEKIMKKSLFKRGFKAVKEEQERVEREKRERQGKLWRVFFPKGVNEDYEIPIRFLTDEPICFYEHTKRVNGKITNIPCIGDGCPECESGDKPRFVGAFLVLDRTEFEYEERDKNGNKTGKKVKGKDRVKLLVRGQTDLAQLAKLNRKYGLLDRDWAISKTGTDTSTKWLFDRGEEDAWTEKEEQNKLPDDLKEKDYYDIVEAQIMGTVEDSNSSSDDDDEDEDLDTGVRPLDEDEDNEDVAPKHTKKTGALSRVANRHKSLKKRK